MELISQNCELSPVEKAKFIEKSSQKMKDDLSGYSVNLKEIFDGKIKNEKQYNSPIKLCDINFYSHCKHHFSPIIGKITISYIPHEWIIGFSRIMDCINAFTQRLQIQEELTIEIAQAIFDGVSAKSVTVNITAKHYCMQQIPNQILPEIHTTHTI